MPDDPSQVAEPGAGVDVSTEQPQQPQQYDPAKEDPAARQRWMQHATDVYQYVQYCRTAAAPKRKLWEEYHKRFQGDKDKINSQLNEIQRKWRSKIQVSIDFSAICVLLARMLGMIRETDPPIQAAGVGPEDTQDEAIQRVFTYTMRANNKQSFWFRLLKNTLIQGWQPVKLTWASEIQTVEVPQSADSLIEYQDAMEQARVLSGLEPDQFMQIQQDPVGLEALMRDLAQSKGFAAPVPPRRNPELDKLPPEQQQGIPPFLPETHDVIKNLGPKLSLPSAWDLYFDPKIIEASEQRMIVHEMKVPRWWILDNTGPRGQINPKTKLPYRYCPEAVAAAGKGFSNDGTQSEEDNVRKKASVSTSGSSTTSNPYAPEMDIIWECWQPSSTEFGYTVLLNKGGKPINHPTGGDPVDEAGTLSPEEWKFPYEHGEQPFFWVTTQPDAFDAFGMSEYDRTIDLLKEADTIRSLRMDAILLLIMGVWQRKGGWATAGGQMSPVPGETFTVAEFGEMKNLYEHVKPDLVTAMGEQEYINNEHDACLGTGGNVRGAEAQVGRVTGSEQAARLERADERVLMRLTNVESGLARMPRQILFLMYQFARQQPVARRMLANVSGLEMFPWYRVLNAMNQDYQLAFTLGRKDKALVSQQAGAWIKDIGMLALNMGIIGPVGMGEAIRQTAQNSGLTNVAKIMEPPPPPKMLPPGEGGGGDGNPEEQAA